MENNNTNISVNQARPLRQLKTNRSLTKTILLSIITLGIYNLVMFGNFSDEINTTAINHDGQKTMNYYLLIFIIAPLTLGIGGLVWFDKFSARVGAELKARNIDYNFGAGSFWLWHTLGLFIIVGPLVYIHKLCKAMNLINADYNERG